VHHAAVVAGVGPGKSAAVVGDGAVGLCGVIAARRLGARQIILLGRHADRIALAREFGPTDIVSERGHEAVERLGELTGGFGVDSVLECVGLEEAELTAIEIARAARVTVGGRPAPVRACIEDLLRDVLEGRIEPGRVFDRSVGSTECPTASGDG
jgi:threonine dehydrogenase-like Zn-dependent dehydrogenase